MFHLTSVSSSSSADLTIGTGLRDGELSCIVAGRICILRGGLGWMRGGGLPAEPKWSLTRFNRSAVLSCTGRSEERRGEEAKKKGKEVYTVHFKKSYRSKQYHHIISKHIFGTAKSGLY